MIAISGAKVGSGRENLTFAPEIAIMSGASRRAEDRSRDTGIRAPAGADSPAASGSPLHRRDRAALDHVKLTARPDRPDAFHACAACFRRDRATCICGPRLARFEGLSGATNARLTIMTARARDPRCLGAGPRGFRTRVSGAHHVVERDRGVGHEQHGESDPDGLGLRRAGRVGGNRR
jgi:hypothetical protein